jgi:hypothetical protein
MIDDKRQALWSACRLLRALAATADGTACAALAVIAAGTLAALGSVACIIRNLLLTAAGQTRRLLAVAIAAFVIIVALALRALALVSAM